MCDCNKTTNISMGCCQPVLGPIEAYYTKFTIDRKLEEITSAITSGCCITPEEVDEKISSAKTEIEGKIPSLSGYATEEYVNVQISSQTSDFVTGVELSSYTYDKAEIDSKIASGGTGVTSGDVQTMIDSSISGKTDNSIFTAHTSDTSVHVTSAEKSTWSSKANVWCGSEADWALISGGTLDNNTIYMVY